MDRHSVGLQLRQLLERHQEAETALLADLPEDAPAQQTFDAIEAASTLEWNGLVLQVRRRRQLDGCPVADCRFDGRRQACPFSNVRFTLLNPQTGHSAAGNGLLWHLLAEHPHLDEVSEDEAALVALLSAWARRMSDG